MTQENKRELVVKLTNNLGVFRAKLGISQDILAEKLGLTRQTISAYENGQREMTWSVFLALIMFYFRNQSTKRLLVALEVYTPELDDFLTIKKAGKQKF